MGTRQPSTAAQNAWQVAGSPPPLPSTSAKSAEQAAAREKGHLPSFFDRVYAVVKLIPRGRVATYGQVAAILEHPRAARTVGWALNGLPAAMKPQVPWHRVINAAGRISNTGNYEEQLRRLKREGIKFDERGYCDLQKYVWDPPPELLQ